MTWKPNASLMAYLIAYTMSPAYPSAKTVFSSRYQQFTKATHPSLT